MKEYENSLEYIKRFSTVRTYYGRSKTFFHIDEMLTVKLVALQNRLTLCAGAFNLKRLYKRINENSTVKMAKTFMEMVKDIMF